MQPLQICIGSTIRIGQESWCLSYAGFFGIGATIPIVSRMRDFLVSVLLSPLSPVSGIFDAQKG